MSPPEAGLTRYQGATQNVSLVARFGPLDPK